MDIMIQPGLLSGSVFAPASKSFAHRALICAALSPTTTRIHCGCVGQDVKATIDCLQAFGAKVTPCDDGFLVSPIQTPPAKASLPCGESGSTLRFLLPVAGALGVEATFLLDGRLPQRPLSPLWEEMERMGCRLSRPTESTILCTGKLRTGSYHIPGNVSSQFISGLLMAQMRLPGSTLTVEEPLQSKHYVTMTKAVMDQFPAASVEVEGDWSNAAFFLAANALGSNISLQGLNPDSLQGDRAIIPALQALEDFSAISAADIPDLIPILAVAAACKKGARFTDISRLRLKESDRVEAILQMLTSLGGKCEATENELTVYPSALLGGVVDSHHDHRIAMAAAIAATVCANPVTITDASCVRKSYPQFWDDYKRLGGRL